MRSKKLKFLALVLTCILLNTNYVWGANATMAGGSSATASTFSGSSGYKCGSGSGGGSMTVTIPAGATVLSVYIAVGFGDSNVSVSISRNSGTISSSSISPLSDSGISGNSSSYTLANAESRYLQTFILSSVNSQTTVTFSTSSKKKRFGVWGAKICYSPSSLTNTEIGSTTATLSWSDTKNVNNYEVYYNTSGTAPAASNSGTATTSKSITLTSLTENTPYYWWVRAYDSYCKTAWVAGTSFTTSSAVSTYTIYLPNTVGSCSSIGSYTSNKGTLGSGTGTFTGYKTYSGIEEGTSVTITASAESGYQFDGWTSGGYCIILDDNGEVTTTSTTSTTATFDMPASDVYIYTCNFSTACDYKVTLTKSAATNGTFLLAINLSFSLCQRSFLPFGLVP